MGTKIQSDIEEVFQRTLDHVYSTEDWQRHYKIEIDIRELKSIKEFTTAIEASTSTVHDEAYAYVSRHFLVNMMEALGTVDDDKYVRRLRKEQDPYTITSSVLMLSQDVGFNFFWDADNPNRAYDRSEHLRIAELYMQAELLKELQDIAHQLELLRPT